MTRHKVAQLKDIKQGEGKLVFAGVKKLAMFLHNGQLHCIQNTCPHAGAFLATGEVQGCLVRCPRHDWAFDFTTGECKSNPRYEIQRYAVEVVDGVVFVEVPEDDGW
jgi:3-phenylpropionate/trans-cinnamate dioxygenase ferredoxin subunit